MPASPSAIRPNDLESIWLPFTPNRSFKQRPRLLEAAEGMYYRSSDGRRVLDAISGLWCVNAGHGRKPIVQAIQQQAAEMDYAPSFHFGHPKVVTLAARLFLYCESNDPGAPVSTQMNEALDSVTAALAPPLAPHGAFRQTLGGLVQHAGIAGEITIAEGLSGQSEAVIPLEILVNS